eukprot:6214625-Pleurochrysis_carterae.AAC.2
MTRRLFARNVRTMATHASLPVATVLPTLRPPVVPAEQGWRLCEAKARPRSGCGPRIRGVGGVGSHPVATQDTALAKHESHFGGT